ncbi:hypothetical protein LEP1GSC076_1439 [Leptospira sp. Fiocruz LV4135]|nr:hypothetical protein LEP1GSC076_1439 [Leptospira sp. Fiocruz LV4135]
MNTCKDEELIVKEGNKVGDSLIQSLPYLNCLRLSGRRQ